MVHAAVSEHRVLFHYPTEQARNLPSMFICTLSKPIFISQIYGLESTLTESHGGPCSLPNSFI